MTGSESTTLSFWERLVQRRHFLVHPRLQYELVRASLRHLCLVAAAGLGVLFVPLAIQIFTNEARSSVAARAAEHLLFLHGHYWPSFLLVVLFVGLDAFRTSHRIAGPIYRFGRILDEVRAGGTPRTFALRRGDLLGDEARAINAALRELALRKAGDEAVRRELVDAARQVRAALAAGTDLTSEGREVLGALLTRAESLGSLRSVPAGGPGDADGGDWRKDANPNWGSVSAGNEDRDRRAA